MTDDQANAPEQTGAPDDLRASLEAAFSTATEPPADAAPSSDRPRDEQGRFAAKATDNQGQAPDPAAAPPQTPDQPPAGATEPAPQAIEPPQSWSAAAKAEWAKLPPAIQQELLKREGDFAKGIESKSLQAKQYEPVARVVESFADVFQRNNLAPAEGIARLLNVQKMLDTDPVGTIQQIAQAYGVNLGQMRAPQQDRQPADPQLAALMQKYERLEQHVTLQQRQQAEAERAQLQAEVDAFSKDRPHFEEARPLMARLIQSGAAPDLATAYDMAVHADPNLRQRILADQRQTEEGKRQEQAQAAAQRARAAAISLTGAPGSGVSPAGAPAENLRAELERQFAGRL